MGAPFEGLLGSNCELRMIEYLLPLEGIEFNVTELSEEVRVSRVTAGRVIKKFLDWGVLDLTRKVGKTAFYSINHDSPIVKSIQQFNNVLIENILGDEILYEIHDYWQDQRPQQSIRTAFGEMPQQHGHLSPNWLQGKMVIGLGYMCEQNVWQREEASQYPTYISHPEAQKMQNAHCSYGDI